MSALERVAEALKEPGKVRTPDEAAQLKADLREIRERAYVARRAGANVRLSRFLQALMRMYEVELEPDPPRCKAPDCNDPMHAKSRCKYHYNIWLQKTRKIKP